VHEIQAEVDSLGATMIGVVCQRRANVERHFAKEPPPLPLVIDEDRSIAKRWGVYHRLGIDAIHIAHPATFVIDSGGRMRFVEVARNQYDRVPFARVVEVLRSL